MESNIPYDLNKLTYSTFVWNFGTTSFRTKQMNFSIEKQLELLHRFWQDPDNARCGWEKEYVAPGQPYDIYEIKNRYYDFMRHNGFIDGDDAIKYKAARQKTSGLADIGVINRNHRLTAVGHELLKISQQGNYRDGNPLAIPCDSLIYLQQLLKYSIRINDGSVRPFVVLLYLLTKIGSLTFDEFTYVAPLCIDASTTAEVVASIPKLRNKEIGFDDLVFSHIMRQDNYREAFAAWMDNRPTEEIVCAIGINRKSRQYDRPYYPLYLALKALFLDHDLSKAESVFALSRKVQVGNMWRELLFDTSSQRTIRNNPAEHLKESEFSAVTTEEDLKRVFFKYLHLFKAKSTLRDYFDLNRRYVKLTSVVLFVDGTLKLDLVPKLLFANAIDELYKLAYSADSNLQQLTPLETICTALKFDESQMLASLNKDLGVELKSVEEAYTEVERLRYERFNNLIKARFTDDHLLALLDDFDSRNDGAIADAVSDNADTPTIFEYVLGIIWYKISEYKGRILDYLKLSLDADLLPVTHAAGGDADIVYEYTQWPPYYPEHSLLLEATLADGNNQRRLEMEPVSRHLGRHLLRLKSERDYCVFATTYLDVNVISDFKSRKHTPFIDPQQPDEYVAGMKIIPLSTSDLREIIRQGKKYRELYTHFEDAYARSDEYLHPLMWYGERVKIPKRSAKTFSGTTVDSSSRRDHEQH